MKLHKNTDILLINLPCTSPAMPAAGPSLTAGRFSRAGQSCVLYDASLDFFLNYVFSEKYFQFFHGMIEEKLEKKIIPSSHAGKIRKLASDIAGCHVSVCDMRRSGFYHPETFMKIKAHIDNLLSWFSYAFFPCRLDFDGFSAPDDISVHDAETNPFAMFCRDMAGHAVAESDPGMIVFHVTDSSQELAHRTMKKFMESRFPGIKSVSIRTDDEYTGNTGFQPGSLRHYPAEECLAPEPVCLPCIAYSDKKNLEEICTSSMICWDMPENGDKLDFTKLWETSKKKIWNHVRILRHTDPEIREQVLQFAGANPNIIHSFEDNGSETHSCPGEKNRIDDRFLPYSDVSPLPGEPFWKILHDPAYIMLYAEKYGQKTLFAMRGERESRSVIQLGSSIDYYFKKPCDLPDGFLDEICKMVEAGGSVDIKYVKYNLQRAYLIAYAMENAVIVGNSSLKHPRKEFIQRLVHTSGIDFTGFLERGYTSVRPEYRAMGVGAKLLEGLTARAGTHKIFSIISEDNKATKKIAIRNKTRKIASYFSEKTGKNMEIWMPEHMIDSLKISEK